MNSQFMGIGPGADTHDTPTHNHLRNRGGTQLNIGKPPAPVPTELNAFAT